MGFVEWSFLFWVLFGCGVVKPKGNGTTNWPERNGMKGTLLRG